MQLQAKELYEGDMRDDIDSLPTPCKRRIEIGLDVCWIFDKAAEHIAAEGVFEVKDIFIQDMLHGDRGT